MHLMIENHGVTIDVENEMFRLSLEGNTRKFSPVKIGSINILSSCMVSTPALRLAVRNQIPVLIFNSSGKVEAWIWSASYGSISTIRKHQAYFCDSEDGLQWIREILRLKTTHQVNNLKWLTERKKRFHDQLTASIGRMEAISLSLADASVQSIRGYEGSISKEYWQIIAQVLEKNIHFPGRVQRYVQDPVNAHLNYLYGILYGVTEASLLMNGIDPYMGVLHRNEYNKKAMLYDYIEPFRPWADRLLIQLFISGKIIRDQHYIQEETGIVKLTKEGKRQTIERFFSLMDERMYLNNKRIKRIDHIHYYSRELAQTLKNYRR